MLQNQKNEATMGFRLPGVMSFFFTDCSALITSDDLIINHYFNIFLRSISIFASVTIYIKKNLVFVKDEFHLLKNLSLLKSSSKWDILLKMSYYTR